MFCRIGLLELSREAARAAHPHPPTHPGAHSQPCDLFSTDRISTDHWDTLCFNKIEIDCCQGVSVWAASAAAFGASGGGQSLSRLGLCGFSFCLQPDVCFVRKGPLLVAVRRVRAPEQGSQGRRHDSFHPAAGGRGLSVRAAAQPPGRDAAPLRDSGVGRTVVPGGCARWWAAPPAFRSARRRAVCSALEGSREEDGGEKGRQESARGGGQGLSLSTESGPALQPAVWQNVYSPAGPFPACLHQKDRTLHCHKHAFSLINRRQ